MEEIKECENSIFCYERDIHILKKSVCELLYSTFKVNPEFRYEEIKNLEVILKNEPLPEIDNLSVLDIQEICLANKQQIELRKLKIEVCIKNRDELRKMLSESAEITRKLKSLNSTSNIIFKQKNEITKISNDNIDREIIGTTKKDILKQDLEELKEELLLKQETNKQLTILYKKYGTSDNLTSTKTYLEELNKILKKD